MTETRGPAPHSGLEAELQAIGGLLGRARERLGAGELIDLGPLEGRVGRLCAGIEALPAEAGATGEAGGSTGDLRAGIRTLIDELGLLARLIELRLAGLRDRLPPAESDPGAPPQKPGA